MIDEKKRKLTVHTLNMIFICTLYKYGMYMYFIVIT